MFGKKRQARRWLDHVGDLFDSEFYRKENPDVAAAHNDKLSAAWHYMTYGWKEGRDPGPQFSTQYYLNTNPDVRTAGKEPLLHYVQIGREEGRLALPGARVAIEPFFDQEYYLKQTSDIGPLAPIDHYLLVGWKHNLDPNPTFSTADYLRLNGDVKRSGMNPLYHFATAGWREGRCTKQVYERHIPACSFSPSVLFIGHSARKTGAEVMLLEVIKWWANNTSYQIDLVLLEGGLLIKQYQKYARLLTLEMDASEDLSAELTEFIRQDYSYVYFNTIASLRIGHGFGKWFHTCPPLVVHIHELSGVLKQFAKFLVPMKQNVSLFIAASNAVADSLTAEFDVPRDRVHVHHSFVEILPAYSLWDAKAEARSKLGLHRSDLVIMGAGTVYGRKGPDVFAETAERVAKQLHGLPVRAIWLGDGEQLQELVEATVAKGIAEIVKFVGFKDEAAQLLAAADVFFLSSREDPFPLVCLEAAQFSVPTVFFRNAGGIIEFTGEDAGFPLPSISTSDAADLISHLLTTEGARRVAGALAHHRVLQSYGAEACALKLFLDLRRTFQIRPAVSALIVAYNHEAYIAERVQSVLRQTLQDFEVIFLDDASTDETVSRASKYLGTDPRAQYVINKQNGGNPFRQWGKGLEYASANLVWIAEGDDSCSTNFLATLLPCFERPRVGLSYAASEVIDEFNNRHPDALRDYLSRVSGDKFSADYIRAGHTEVEESLAVACTIPNVSAVVFRIEALRCALPIAHGFQMCGDWAIYLSILQRWNIAYHVDAKNRFRRHSGSVVHRIEGTEQYFVERDKIVRQVVERFGISTNCADRMRVEVEREWHRFHFIEKGRKFLELFDSALEPPIRRKCFRIGFYVHGLLFSVGGIEKAASLLADTLATRGHKVFIFCRAWSESAPVFSLDPTVTMVPVFSEIDPNATLALRSEIVRADLDVFVPMLSEWLFEPIIAAAEGLSFPIIASEHNDPWMIEKIWWSKGARLDTFAKVAAIHLLLEKFRFSIPAGMQEKVFVIPNPIEPRVSHIVREDVKPHRVIGVGRLVPQKRFDRLVRAFANVISQLGDESPWNLVVYGDGPERQRLLDLTEHLQVTRRVAFRGTTNDVLAEMAKSSFCVVPSEFEGFGIVVIEAKRVGIPCIAYEDCNGPNELIHSGTDGLLVPPDQDGSNLINPMLRLMTDPSFCETLGNAAREHVESFEVERVADAWETNIQHVTEIHRARRGQ
jgi:glycosyltransferase involved in cell wall biosynthesis